MSQNLITLGQWFPNGAPRRSRAPRNIQIFSLKSHLAHVVLESDHRCDIKSVFEEHLSQLINWFEKYFQEDNIDKFAWIQDPFRAKAPSEFTSVASVATSIASQEALSSMSK
jgi:hypothetical protein